MEQPIKQPARYIRTESSTGKIYWKCPSEVSTIHIHKYYDANKVKIVRQKILKMIELKGRIPTITSVEKYVFTPKEMITAFNIFKKNCNEEEILKKCQDKLMLRISSKWS